MASSLTRKRRSASRIFILLILLAAAGAAVYLKYFHRPGDSTASGGIVALPALERFDATRTLMDTEFEIAVYAPDEATATSAIAASFARGTFISEACSAEIPGSDLSKLHAAPAGTPVGISPTFSAVLAHALDTADVTSGMFDPTLGTFTALWRQSLASGTLPDPATLAAARETSGWKYLEVDLPSNTATLGKPGMKIDLDGITRGYALDEMLRVLEQQGITSAMIRAGSDARVGSPPPEQKGWRVQLGGPASAVREAVVVANCAVSTADALRDFVDIGGTRYAHLIDPATGIGITRPVAATIIAPTATQSAPLATFACIAPDTAIQVFIGGEIRCRVVTINGLDLQDRRSPNFPNLQGF